jgi:hypothetical protein
MARKALVVLLVSLVLASVHPAEAQQPAGNRPSCLLTSLFLPPECTGFLFPRTSYSSASYVDKILQRPTPRGFTR